MWDEIIYPYKIKFPNFNGKTVDIWEWICILIPQFILDVMLGLKLDRLSKLCLWKKKQLSCAVLKCRRMFHWIHHVEWRDAFTSFSTNGVFVDAEYYSIFEAYKFFDPHCVSDWRNNKQHFVVIVSVTKRSCWNKHNVVLVNVTQLTTVLRLVTLISIPRNTTLASPT